jgi:hypothetical protein
MSKYYKSFSDKDERLFPTIITRTLNWSGTGDFNDGADNEHTVNIALHNMRLTEIHHYRYDLTNCTVKNYIKLNSEFLL